VEAITTGDPLDPATMIGAQASNDQLEKILSYLDIGRSEGAGSRRGSPTPGGRPRGGYYVEPTVGVPHRQPGRVPRCGRRRTVPHERTPVRLLEAHPPHPRRGPRPRRRVLARGPRERALLIRSRLFTDEEAAELEPVTIGPG
jgi:hypothetical protein